MPIFNINNLFCSATVQKALILLKLIGLFLVASSFLRLVALIYNYDYFVALEPAEILFALVYGLRFDVSILVIFVFPSFLIFSSPLTHFKNINSLAIFWYLLFFVFYSLFSVTSMVFFTESNKHITSELLFMQGEITNLAGLVTGYIIELILSIIFCAAFIWAVLKLKLHQPIKHNFKPKNIKFATIAVLTTSCFLIVSLVLQVILLRGGIQRKPLGTVNAYILPKSEFGNLVANPVYIAYQYIIDFEQPVNIKISQAQALKNLKLKGDYPFMLQHKKTPEQVKKNVVFIAMESWSPYFVGAYGSDWGVTPHFDKLTKKSAVFNNFYANGTRSILGMQSILTGVMPFEGIPFISFGLETINLPKLGSIIGKQGYKTLFAEASFKGSFRVDAVSKMLGFEQYYSSKDYPEIHQYQQMQHTTGWDYEMFDFMAKKLLKQTQPFFAFLFTATVHQPYLKTPFDKFKRDGTAGFNSFKNSVVYSDESLHNFMEQMKKHPNFKNTIFIITADHALPRYTKDKSLKNKFHIPFIIYNAGDLKNIDKNAVYSQTNLLASFIDLLNIDTKFATTGASIFNQKAQHNKAIVVNGDVTGLITKNGFISQTGGKLLNYKGIKKPVAEKHNNYLLSMQKLIQTAVNHNKWFDNKQEINR